MDAPCQNVDRENIKLRINTAVTGAYLYFFWTMSIVIFTFTIVVYNNVQIVTYLCSVGNIIYLPIYIVRKSTYARQDRGCYFRHVQFATDKHFYRRPKISLI